MWRDLRDNWRDVGYWRWWWGEFLSGEAKLGLALAVAIAIALAGFLSAEAMSSGSESSLTVAPRVLTVQRTMLRKVVSVRTVPVTDGVTRIVTEGRTVYVPGEATTVMHVITVRAPGKGKVVTRSHVSTVLLPTTVSQPVTVTVEGAPVTATVTRDVPGPTVTRTPGSPPRTVTRPGPAVTTTVPGPTLTLTTIAPPRTVTHEVTTPGPTVTSTLTVPVRSPCPGQQ